MLTKLESVPCQLASSFNQRIDVCNDVWRIKLSRKYQFCCNIVTLYSLYTKSLMKPGETN